jgi:hypothetical protein
MWHSLPTLFCAAAMGLLASLRVSDPHSFPCCCGLAQVVSTSLLALCDTAGLDPGAAARIATGAPELLLLGAEEWLSRLDALGQVGVRAWLLYVQADSHSPSAAWVFRLLKDFFFFGF